MRSSGANLPVSSNYISPWPTGTGRRMPMQYTWYTDVCTRWVVTIEMRSRIKEEERSRAENDGGKKAMTFTGWVGLFRARSQTVMLSTGQGHVQRSRISDRTEASIRIVEESFGRLYSRACRPMVHCGKLYLELYETGPAESFQNSSAKS